MTSVSSPRRDNGSRNRFLAIALLALVVATSCSQGRKRDLADTVIRTANRDRGVLAGTMVVSFRPARIAGSDQLRAMVRGATLASLGVAVDRRTRTAAVTGGGADRLVVYSPDTIYARRITRSPADKRLWARLELKKLEDAEITVPDLRELSQTSGPGDIAVIDPVFLTDLLAGVLTGSVKVKRTDETGSRLITFNTSISKAQRKFRLKESVRKERTQLLRSLAITGDIHPGEVVLRKDGSLAKARFSLGERPDKQTRINLDVELTFVPSAPKVDLAAPDRSTTVRVPELGTLKGTIRDRLLPPGARA
jgi:hypothetical protein